MSEATLEKKRDYSVIGHSFPKKDARDKATGRARYAGDMKLPNMLIGKILRSPHAHARILKIDTSKAEALPGVKAVITAKDVPSTLYGISPARYDENIFAIEKVLYVGDKVAAVAAVDEETATKALGLIEVEYEVLQPVLDPLRAMDEDQPQLHPQYPRNINVEIHQNFGDVDKAFAEAYYVRTDTFSGTRTTHVPMEPHAAISKWEDGKLTIWSSTQSPHYFQYHIARVFGLKMADVRVIKAQAVGGGFGGKLEPSGAEYVSAALAMKTGRPVKIVFDRWEVFVHHRGRHPQYITLTIGVTKEGKILGLHAKFIIDGGAYTSLGIASAYYAGAMLPLIYDFENYRFDGFRVHTNLPSCGAQRGHGAPQPRYAFESQIDLVAKHLGIDPIEMRLLNARKPNTKTPNDFQINSCAFTEAILKARDISGWKEKKGKLVGKGIGIGCGGFISGNGYAIYRTRLPHSGAVIKVSEQGDAATLYTGAVDIGQGSDTVLAMMAAEAIGINYEDIKLVTADTETTPHDFGAYASRQTLMSGWAVKQAGEEIRQKVRELAAEMMEANVEDVEVDRGVVFVKGSPDKTLPFAQVANEYFIRKGPLVGTGKYAPPKLGGTFKGAAVGTSPAYSFAAQISEVEVDEETGQVMVTDVWDVHDCGKVINPMLLHAQVEGALFMGMGEAMYEAMVFDANGKPLNANLGEYRIPTALDVPHMVSELVDSYEPAGPWGVKEVGEGATIPTMGSYTNAIFDAIGIRIYDMPLTPEKVWRAIQERKRLEAEAKK